MHVQIKGPVNAMHSTACGTKSLSKGFSGIAFTGAFAIFLQGFDWDALASRRMEPPRRPKLSDHQKRKVRLGSPRPWPALALLCPITASDSSMISVLSVVHDQDWGDAQHLGLTAMMLRFSLLILYGSLLVCMCWCAAAAVATDMAH